MSELGVTGACPRSGFAHPPTALPLLFGSPLPLRAEYAEPPPRREGVGRSMACVCVKIRRVDFDALASNRSPSARIYQGEGCNDGDVR